MHVLGLQQAQEQGRLRASRTPSSLKYLTIRKQFPLEPPSFLILAWNRRHAAVLFAEWLQDLAVDNGS
jgi:hypothetical protein